MEQEIPLELWLLREIDFSHYLSKETDRRFNLRDGEYVEVDPHYKRDYEVAPFAEYELTYHPAGRTRMSRITIIYARVIKTPLVYCS